MSLSLFFHAPLHCLRKTSLYSFLLKTRLNNPRLTDLGLPFPVAIRPLTHASIRWAKRRQEPGIAQLFTRILKALDKSKGKKFFYDIGANHGHYTWMTLNQSQNMEVMAFEPDPKNLELLRLTVNHSNLHRVRIREVALSDGKGETSFHQDPLTSATGMIENGETPWIEKYLGRKSITIQVKRSMLDSFCTPETKPSLIKVDVEGHELQVLRGGQECLQNHKPVLIVESFPPKQEEVLCFLSALGYEIRDADRNTQVSDQTNNLLAWSKAGPLNSSDIREILQS